MAGNSKFQNYETERFVRQRCRSSVAEYPFATLTSYGATIPPPRGTHGERSADGGASSPSGDENSLVTAVKVTSILFLSAALIVTTFYVAIFARRWKKKRGLNC